MDPTSTAPDVVSNVSGPYLLVTGGPLHHRWDRFPLRSGLLIGSSQPDVQIVIYSDVEMEPRHARLIQRDEGWFVEHVNGLSTVNGQVVNGVARRIDHGDSLRVGNTFFKFSDGRPLDLSRQASRACVPV